MHMSYVALQSAVSSDNAVFRAGTWRAVSSFRLLDHPCTEGASGGFQLSLFQTAMWTLALSSVGMSPSMLAGSGLGRQLRGLKEGEISVPLAPPPERVLPSPGSEPGAGLLFPTVVCGGAAAPGESPSPS